MRPEESTCSAGIEPQCVCQPAFVGHHSFQEKQAASSELVPSLLPLQQRQRATALLSVGLPPAFQNSAPACPGKHGSGGSLHRVLLMQSTKSLGLARAPGALCRLWWLRPWLMHPGLMLYANLEQLHHYSCGSAAAFI